MDADLEQQWAQWSDYIPEGILEDVDPSPVSQDHFIGLGNARGIPTGDLELDNLPATIGQSGLQHQGTSDTSLGIASQPPLDTELDGGTSDMWMDEFVDLDGSAHSTLNNHEFCATGPGNGGYIPSRLIDDQYAIDGIYPILFNCDQTPVAPTHTYPIRQSTPGAFPLQSVGTARTEARDESSLQSQLPSTRKKVAAHRRPPTSQIGGSFSKFSTKIVNSADIKITKSKNKEIRACTRCHALHLKCDRKRPCSECFNRGKSPKVWAMELCGPVVLADDIMFLTGSFDNPLIYFEYVHFAQVSLRLRCPNWELTSGLPPLTRLGVDAVAMAQGINAEYRLRVREWFKVPQLLKKDYPSGLSKASMDLDVACKSLYRANELLQQLAFKACFGPSDEIDPQHMILIQFYANQQACMGKDALALLQRNINRAIHNRASVQDGMHTSFWIYLTLQMLEGIVDTSLRTSGKQDNTKKIKFLMEILEHQDAKIRRKTPENDLGRLCSIFINFLQIQLSQPLSLQLKTLGPKKPQELGNFEDATLFLPDPNLDLVDNYIRKVRIFALSQLISREYKRTSLDILLMTTLDSSQVMEDEFWILVKESSRVLLIVSKFLLSKGINICKPDGGGRHPLLLAVSEGDVDVVAFLLDNGASADWADRNGWRPLHVASRRGYVEIADMLLKHHSEVHAVTGNNLTPLHIACMFRQPSIIRVLLNHGADPMAIDGYGHCCIDWAKADPETLLALGPIPDLTPDHQLRKQTALRISIRDDLASIITRSYSSLARKLMYIGDLEAALVLWEQNITRHPGSSFSHKATCSLCSNHKAIVGPRYVCMTCAAIDLCAWCMKKYTGGTSAVRGCSGHTFLEVPRAAWRDLEEPAVNSAGESFPLFLENLKTAYGVS